jgi:hypothetical protein
MTTKQIRSASKRRHYEDERFAILTSPNAAKERKATRFSTKISRSGFEVRPDHREIGDDRMASSTTSATSFDSHDSNAPNGGRAVRSAESARATGKTFAGKKRDRSGRGTPAASSSLRGVKT